MVYLSGLGAVTLKTNAVSTLSSFGGRAFLIKYLMTKLHRSPDQAKGYNGNGMYTAIQRHPPALHISIWFLPTARCLSNHGVISTAP